MEFRSLDRVALVAFIVTLVGVSLRGTTAAESSCFASQGSCRIVSKSKRIELHSPAFVYRLNAESELRAESWLNRLTGKTISMGGGPELELDIGLPDGPVVTPEFRVTQTPKAGVTAVGECVFQLAADNPRITARVTYRWDAKQPILHKFVEIQNTDSEQLNRLLNVRLGSYNTDAKVSGSERGFPLYINDEFFLTLAHPAGWATGKDGQVDLHHFPGVKLQPGGKFKSMETIYGVSKAGSARECFLDHLRSRMRRVVRRHDKPYAIFETFGGAPDGDIFLKERYILEMLDKLAQGQATAGYQFDMINTHFWVDYYGDLKRTDPNRFPGGLKNIHAAIEKLGARPGLWIDSSWELWSIGGNPDVQSCLNLDPQRPETVYAVPWNRPSFCRATQPIKSMYTDAFRYHIRENDVRLLKFDNLATLCVNPNHDHLPGIYSTEPIINAAIEFLNALDAECPDVFLMLYWGFRSPWWLLYGDALFDSGIEIEAAHPSDLPSVYVRQSVIQKLDQAQWHAQDIPSIGKDSLGIWLSDWPWNSSIGKERWQEAFVMDMSRGSLLAQIWTDADWLSPPERKQIADFIALLKARPECFGNPRFILGDPRKNEPYGYCSSGPGRAFLALHNCCWKDSLLSLELNSTWGIPDGQTWDLYRWYPNPARLDGGPFGEQVSIRLRPFEVVLLEAVPSGELPSLDRKFEIYPIPVDFAQSSRTLEIAAEQTSVPDKCEQQQVIVKTKLPPNTGGGTLVVSVEIKKEAKPVAIKNVGEHFSAQAKLTGQTIQAEPVLGKATYPSSWQAWRIHIEPSMVTQDFELIVEAAIADSMQKNFNAYFIPLK